MKANCFNLIFATASLVVATAFADVSTFTETFDSGDANWVAGTFAPLGTEASGGPDGSAYVTTDSTFEFSADDDSLVLFRGQDGFDASNDAFVGDWITSGVDNFSFSFRHDSPVPLSVFARFASPANFPGAIAVEFAPTFANTWTDISFDINAFNPQIFYEGPGYGPTFSNIGNIQIGVSVPTGFGGVPGFFTFDLDNATVNVVPEPASGIALLALGSTLFVRRRR